ncbi:hypothetical protein, conserved [Eimeria necatrix]|uniref:Uncharacterized protein n=1 Tax=Eimeria necatrix TaxID=51315 RepID=U6MYZ5_9EIME|nr:hypothetical protein, conserved [Eimeria necatrix]CDJ66925.1 hypothetical protein, conserved [Eimeria necatrix]
MIFPALQPPVVLRHDKKACPAGPPYRASGLGAPVLRLARGYRAQPDVADLQGAFPLGPCPFMLQGPVELTPSNRGQQLLRTKEQQHHQEQHQQQHDLCAMLSHFDNISPCSRKEITALSRCGSRKYRLVPAPADNSSKTQILCFPGKISGCMQTSKSAVFTFRPHGAIGGNMTSAALPEAPAAAAAADAVAATATGQELKSNSGSPSPLAGQRITFYEDVQLQQQPYSMRWTIMQRQQQQEQQQQQQQQEHLAVQAPNLCPKVSVKQPKFLQVGCHTWMQQQRQEQEQLPKQEQEQRQQHLRQEQQQHEQPQERQRQDLQNMCQEREEPQKDQNQAKQQEDEQLQREQQQQQQQQEQRHHSAMDKDIKQQQLLAAELHAVEQQLADKEALLALFEGASEQQQRRQLAQQLQQLQRQQQQHNQLLLLIEQQKQELARQREQVEAKQGEAEKKLLLLQQQQEEVKKQQQQQQAAAEEQQKQQQWFKQQQQAFQKAQEEFAAEQARQQQQKQQLADLHARLQRQEVELAQKQQQQQQQQQQLLQQQADMQASLRVQGVQLLHQHQALQRQLQQQRELQQQILDHQRQQLEESQEALQQQQLQQQQQLEQKHQQHLHQLPQLARPTLIHRVAEGSMAPKVQQAQQQQQQQQRQQQPLQEDLQQLQHQEYEDPLLAPRWCCCGSSSPIALPTETQPPGNHFAAPSGPPETERDSANSTRLPSAESTNRMGGSEETNDTRHMVKEGSLSGGRLRGGASRGSPQRQWKGSRAPQAGSSQRLSDERPHHSGDRKQCGPSGDAVAIVGGLAAGAAQGAALVQGGSGTSGVSTCPPRLLRSTESQRLREQSLREHLRALNQSKKPLKATIVTKREKDKDADAYRPSTPTQRIRTNQQKFSHKPSQEPLQTLQQRPSQWLSHGVVQHEQHCGPSQVTMKGCLDEAASAEATHRLLRLGGTLRQEAAQVRGFAQDSVHEPLNETIEGAGKSPFSSRGTREQQQQLQQLLQEQRREINLLLLEKQQLERVAVGGGKPPGYPWTSGATRRRQTVPREPYVQSTADCGAAMGGPPGCVCGGDHPRTAWGPLDAALAEVHNNNAGFQRWTKVNEGVYFYGDTQVGRRAPTS